MDHAQVEGVHTVRVFSKLIHPPGDAHQPRVRHLQQKHVSYRAEHTC